MGEIQVDMNNNNSTLFDQFERLTVEIQLNQAILRRSLSEPGKSFFVVGSTAPQPRLVRQPVEQGKKGRTPWQWGFNKIVKKLVMPMMFRRRKGKVDDHPEDKPNFKDLRSWRKFSQSVRH